MRWATTAHNLADTLVRARRNLGETLDAVRLCEDSLVIRPRLGEPIYLWETHHLLGDAVLACIPALDAADLGTGTRAGLWFQGCAALVKAMSIARGLGGGERLFRSGFVLARLACLAADLPTLTAAAESAWQAMDEARPFLLHREEDAVRESAVLAEITALTATMHAQTEPIGVLDGCAFVLGGAAAWDVSRWLVRATGCTQRRLNARWRRPIDVDPATWTGWIAAVHSGDPLRIALALAAVRARAPEFLSGEPTFAGLSTWLRAAPDAAAFVVLPTRLGLIAAIYDGADGLRCHVAALTAVPPQALRELVAVEADTAPACYDEAVAWGRSALVLPLLAVHARPVRRVLWCASGPIRGISPHDLWPGVAVTLASDPAIHATPAPASPTTAIVVADPGPGAAGELTGIVEVGTVLAREVASADLRVRLGRGPVHGRALGLDCPGLIDAPPEPDGVLQDLVECKRVVLLCHGVSEGVEDAAVLLLDAEGRQARLDLRRIAEDPRSFAGATVLLLACETGRAGPWIHRAAGFPGVLLACGAQRLLAPLWPVFSDVAVTVGGAVLRALERGTSPADVLAELVDQAAPMYRAADRPRPQSAFRPIAAGSRSRLWPAGRAQGGARPSRGESRARRTSLHAGPRAAPAPSNRRRPAVRDRRSASGVPIGAPAAGPGGCPRLVALGCHLVVPEIDDPAEPVAAPSAAAYRVDAVGGEGVAEWRRAEGRVPVTRRT